MKTKRTHAIHFVKMVLLIVVPGGTELVFLMCANVFESACISPRGSVSSTRPRVQINHFLLNSSSFLLPLYFIIVFRDLMAFAMLLFFEDI